MTWFDPRSYEMSPYDNVLYFANNVDVRLCPKNAMTTLKELHSLSTKSQTWVGRRERYQLVQQYGDQFDLPFRKGSYRIAVRRDPLDRFKSACEYITRERINHIKNGRDLPEIGKTIDEVLDSIENETTKNIHFYTQTWFNDNPDDYHAVYWINEIDKLLNFLISACDIPVTNPDIHLNKTIDKLYNDSLTEEQVSRIKQLYKKDYRNGWCKIEDRI